MFRISLIYLCGYVMLLGRQVIYGEFSDCYDDANICLWTNGSKVTLHAARTACQQRNSFLLRITNNNTQSKLARFRNDSGNLLVGTGFWIDVTLADDGRFHWIDDSSFANGGEVRRQNIVGTPWSVVIAYVNRQFVFSARRWDNQSSSYICQLPQQGCSTAAGDLLLNSKCYRKFDVQMSWFSASNDCLSRGGSLAVFTHIASLSDSRQLTDWLYTNKTYWIGLVRFWWKTAGEDFMQYSNWGSGHPNTGNRNNKCVVVQRHNYWNSFSCYTAQRFVCQNYTGPTTTTTTTPVSSTASSTTVNGQSVKRPTPSSTTSISSSSAQPGDERDNTITVIVAVVAPCLAVVVIVVSIAEVVYCYQVNKNRNAQRADKPPTTDVYAMLDRDTQAQQQPQYDVIQLGQHDNAHRARRVTAADDYVTLDTQTQGQHHQYDVIGLTI